MLFFLKKVHFFRGILVKKIFCGNVYSGGKKILRLMKKSVVLRIWSFLFVFSWQSFLCNFAVAEGKYYSWDFTDCDLKDIIFAVSLDTGISIVTDDTVSGKGDLKFSGDDFVTAFDAFLNSSRLCVKKEDKVWTVSRFSLIHQDELFYLDSYDLMPSQILEKLSEEVNSVITFDSLPTQRITVHFKGIDEKSLMESLAKRFGSYDVVCEKTGYHFVKKVEQRIDNSLNRINKIEKIDDQYSINLKDCSFSDVINELFEIEKTYGVERDYCLLVSGDVKIPRTVFFGNDFTGTLNTLCSACGIAYVQNDNLFYFFADGNSKTELITGKRNWRKVSLRYTKSQDFITFITKRIGKIENILLPDEYSFLCFVSENEYEIILDLIKAADLKKSTYLVNLKYIKPSVLMEHLPPSIDKNALFIADDNECIYFTGTEDAYNNLCSQLDLCDRPEKNIRYDLLIIQYDETKQNLWSSSVKCKKITAGDRNNTSVLLGSVMDLNLNVVSTFGLTFATELQSSLEENKAKVYADTTLYGISGKQINFQNTNTYRYRDNNVDPETGIPIYSGVTREIVSGIKLDILGWVSGDGMITSKVTASVSRCGTDTSSSTGNPPPTSEKVVTTEVCGKSGEPVILSGLIQNSETNQEKKTPGISKIPLLGNLFKSKNENSEKTQMIIYLVPHVDNGIFYESEKMRIDDEYVETVMGKIMNLVSISDREEIENGGANE